MKRNDEEGREEQREGRNGRTVGRKEREEK